MNNEKILGKENENMTRDIIRQLDFILIIPKNFKYAWDWHRTNGTKLTFKYYRSRSFLLNLITIRQVPGQCRAYTFFHTHRKYSEIHMLTGSTIWLPIKFRNAEVRRYFPIHGEKIHS